MLENVMEMIGKRYGYIGESQGRQGMLKIWEAKISRSGWKMKATDVLCERHFNEEDIIDSFEVNIGGQVIKEPIKKRLKPDAIPVKFPHKDPKPKRKGPAQRLALPVKKRKQDNTTALNNETTTEETFTLETSQNDQETVDATENDQETIAPAKPAIEINISFCKKLHLQPSTVKVPEDWIIRNKDELAFIHINDHYKSDKYVLFKKNSTYAQVYINSTEVPHLNQATETFQEVNYLLQSIHLKKICPGTGIDEKRSAQCLQILEGEDPPPRCISCLYKRRALQKMDRRKLESTEKKKKKAKKQEAKKSERKKLLRKIKTLEEKLQDQMDQYDKLKKESVDQFLSTLPPKQKLAVEACISAAKVKGPNGRRYTKQWMYECILMRFRGPALYRKMQRENTLPLPSTRTIQRYLKKMSPAYGFQRATFELLAEKAKEMPEDERHGALLLDEMKVEEGLYFNKPGLRVEGVVYMDRHTPDSDKDKTGDHALVLMFQPFKGTWLQTVAAMLTKGAAKGKELAMIVLDAVTRLEQCLLHVDIISSDGASWNRTMWVEMGMLRTEKERELDENEEDILAALETEEEWEQSINLDIPFYNEKNLPTVQEGDMEVQEVEVEVQSEEVQTEESSSRGEKKRIQRGKQTTKKKQAPKKVSKRKQAEEHRSKFVSVEHPLDSKRRLWFASDFPHLAKTMKDRVLKQKILKTPDGTVMLSHWERLYDVDKVKGIRVAPKLSADHFAKEGYLTMRVKLAYSVRILHSSFFVNEEVAVAMEHYSKEKVSGLEDVSATVSFIRRINKLIDAMDARCPFKSLKAASSEQPDPEHHEKGVTAKNYGPQSPKQSREFVEEFLAFLKKWECSGVKRCFRFTSQTAFGLRVTLTAALELTDYLSKELGYSYFMTKRMSQDALEHFFGKVRQSCGPGCHPTPLQFIQVYRLLSVGSLIKPPRGSNITGAEMLDSLLKVEDLVEEDNRQRRVELENALDEALDSGEIVDCIDKALGDHRYSKDYKLEEKALRYFSGYVARKARKTSTAKTCQECFVALSAPIDQEHMAIDDIIVARSKGNLIIPSDKLWDLVRALEVAVLDTIHVKNLTSNIIFAVLDHVRTRKYEEIGCETHKRKLTKDIMSFYLNTRIIFAAEEYNRVQSENVAKKRKAKQLQKNHRLMV
ncbi:Transposable element P transposase [Frankliniella fusca]|uniref:Transposable element P transposase n=1 Tax=Frankliniella fusca TaxID=407009 RepID=A0AAE1LDZ8_9NEOP|nr:Transposable element P transposase [Frankliniella fusca]